MVGYSRHRTFSIVVAFIILFSGIPFFLFNDVRAEEPLVWFDDDWGYCKNITVSNKYADYPTKIVLYKDSGTYNCSGHCNNNFSDIRFACSNGTSIPYFIQNYTDGSRADVWVKNEYNVSDFYIYYGNVNAVNDSNGTRTFLVYDDFNDGVINTTKWDTGTDGGATIQEKLGKIFITSSQSESDYSGACLVSDTALPSGNYVVETLSRRNYSYGAGELGLHTGLADKRVFDSTYYGCWSDAAGSRLMYYPTSGYNLASTYDTTTTYGSPTNWDRYEGYWVDTKVVIDNTNGKAHSHFIYATENGWLNMSSGDADKLSANYVQLGYGSYKSTGKQCSWEYIMVYSYISGTKPSLTFGEQYAVGASIDLPVPSDSAVDVSVLLTELSVFINATQGGINWTIETLPDIGSQYNWTEEGSGLKVCSISGLQYNTTYTWYVNATLNTTTNTSENWTHNVFSFTTQDFPEMFTSESPLDDIENVSVSTTELSVYLDAGIWDKMNWTIETVPDAGSQYNWSSSDDSGVKTCSLSNLVSYRWYTWYVNVTTDSSAVANATESWINAVYTFRVEPEWWDANWKYRKEIYLNNRIDDYQIPVTLNYTSGNYNCSSHSKADFSDVRFVYGNNTAVLDYWIENYTSGEQARFWVLDDYPTGNIFMYYGKDDATSTSNGTNTFLLYDDFSGTTQDPRNLWTETGSIDWSTNGDVKLNSSEALLSDILFSYDTRFRCRSKANEQDIDLIRYSDSATVSANNLSHIECSDYYYDGDFDTFRVHTKNNITDSMHQFVGWETCLNRYQVYEIARTHNTNYFKQNTTHVANVDTGDETGEEVPVCDMYVGWVVWSPQESTLTVDWCFVAKYSSSEPTFKSVRSEEQRPTSLVFTNIQPTGVGLELTPIANVTINNVNGLVSTVDWYNSTDNSTWTHFAKFTNHPANTSNTTTCSFADQYATTYYLKVTSYDTYVNSSVEWDFTTRASYMPNTPASFVATVVNRTVLSLTWIDDIDADATYIEYDSSSHDTWNRGDYSYLGNETDGAITHTGLSHGQTVYYKAWSYNITDKLWSVGATTSNTTNSNQLPVYSSESPSNASGVPVQYVNWSVYIEDGEGDSFDWWMNCSSGNQSSGLAGSNGTKYLNMTGLPWDITYTVWVNTTDSYGWTREWFLFSVGNYTPVNATIISAVTYERQINLSWSTDYKTDFVYVEWDATNDTSWSRGDHNYTGVNSSSGSGNHIHLRPSTTYYYKSWSYNATGHMWSATGSNVFDNVTIGNNAPTTDTDTEVPTNSSVDQNTFVSLSINLTDLDDADTMNVTFYNASNNVVISVDTNAITTASVVWYGLSVNVEYSWYVTVDDSYDNTTSDWWNFTTAGRGEVWIDDNHPNPYWYDTIHVHTLSEAVTNASSGGSLYVYAGTYAGPVSVNKQLNISGNGTSTKISGLLGTVDGFDITVSGVNVSNFWVWDCSIGIDIHVSGCIVLDVTISECDTGVNVSSATSGNISGNHIYVDSVGVSLYSSENIELFDNVIDTNGSSGDGILFDTCSYVNVSNSDISGFYAGMNFTWGNDNNTVVNNYITYNSIGLLLDEWEEYDVFHTNHITDNTYGVNVDGDDNLFYNNYFDNTNNAYDTGSNSWNVSLRVGTNIIDGPYIMGNYWSDYTGSDITSDGIGDTPYNIPP